MRSKTLIFESLSGKADSAVYEANGTGLNKVALQPDKFDNVV